MKRRRNAMLEFIAGVFLLPTLFCILIAYRLAIHNCERQMAKKGRIALTRMENANCTMWGCTICRKRYISATDMGLVYVDPERAPRPRLYMIRIPFTKIHFLLPSAVRHIFKHAILRKYWDVKKLTPWLYVSWRNKTPIEE
jgi:hypothetical protein